MVKLVTKFINIRTLFLVFIISNQLCLNSQDYHIYGWGYNSKGTLGNNNNAEISDNFTKLSYNGDIKFLDCNGSILINSNNELWSWGYFIYKIKDPNSKEFSNIPLLIEQNTEWIEISSGPGFILAIKNDSTLWAWGENKNGELGLGDTKYRYEPTLVDSTSKWINLSAGVNFSLGIKSDGTLWRWGTTYYKVNPMTLGSNDLLIPTQIGEESNWVKALSFLEASVASKSDGTLWEFGVSDGYIYSIDPKEITNSSGFKNFQINNSSILTIANDGTLWSKRLFLGQSFALLNDSLSWNDIAVGLNFYTAISTEGKLYAWGNNLHSKLNKFSSTELRFPQLISDDSDWLNIYAGAGFSFATKKDIISSVNKIENKTINIYPNPSTDFLYIHFVDYPVSYSFEIYDAYGNSIMSKNNYNNNKIQLDEIIKSNGLYFITIQNGIFNYKEKFIINR